MTSKPLKFLVLGAGGIGGYYAAKLAQAGHELVITARGQHLDALQERGLRVEYEGHPIESRIPAYNHTTLISTYHPDDFDLVIITLKSTATEPMMAEIGEWLKQGVVPVLSLQNGVDNEPNIAQEIGTQRVLGGLAVRIGGHITEPGIVFAEGVAQIIMGVWPSVEDTTDPRVSLLNRLESAFNEAGIPTTISGNIRYELWRKLVINNGVNPLSALTGLDTRSLTQHSEFGIVVKAMMRETVEASRADGVNLTLDDLKEMFELISSFNAIKTSMLVDKEKGRSLELESISGAVLKRCEILGVPAPYTFLVNALLSNANSQDQA